MYSSCTRSIHRNTTWSAIHISLQRNIPKFDTVLLHSNWSSLRRKYLGKIPTDVNALSCGPKTWKISGISDIFPARHPQKSSQHVRACAAGDGAICSKYRIIVPYHGDKPNTRNGARLRSPIMAPDTRTIYTFVNLNPGLALTGFRTTWPRLQQVNLTWARDPIEKPALGQGSTLKKHVTSISSKLEPTIWSGDTDQRIPWFDRCQLTIIWISNIKEGGYKTRLSISVNLLA